MQSCNIHGTASGLYEKAESLLQRSGIRFLLRILLPLAAGFGLARTPLPGGIYPFGAAWCAALSGGSSAAAIAGVLLGFILPGSGAESLRCAASALAAAGIKWALSELRPVKDSPLFPPLSVLAGVVLTGLVVTSSVGAAVSFDLARYLAEGTMAAACTFFFCSALDSWQHRSSRRFTSQELYCLAAAVCVLLVPLCRLSLLGFSPFVPLVIALSLALVHRYGASGGGAAGIGLGVVLALAGMRFSLLGVSALACLAAALFGGLGAWACAAAFWLSCCLGAAASGQLDLAFLAESALGAVLYPVIGERRFAPVLAMLEPVSRLRRNAAADDRMCRRLARAALGLEQAAATVDEVSRRLERMETPGTEIICRQARKEICADCAISRFCWDTAAEETRRLFDAMGGLIRRDGRLHAGNTTEQMRSRCARWGELSQRVNALYAEFDAGETARRQVAHIRQVMTGQMAGCGRLLSELAEESGREERQSAELSRRAAEELAAGGIAAEDVSCTARSEEQLTLTLTLRADEQHPEPELDAADILSELFETWLEQTSLERQGDSLTLRLDSKPRYSLSVGAVQHVRGGARLCGDAYRVLSELPGERVVLLSDGMGTGGRAAVDSAMSCELMSRLIEAGFSESGAMEMVNSALQISSREETLATMDCVRVDLYTGRVRICKAGAADSYILKNGRAREIDFADTLPLGIMGQVESDSRCIYMEEGDVLVMASDGVRAGEDWLQREVSIGQGNDVSRMARDIMALAMAQSGEEDDATVIVIRLESAAAEHNTFAA